MSEQQPTVLQDYLGVLQRRWKVIVAATVAGVLIGVLTAMVLPKEYAATSSVALSPGSIRTGQVSINCSNRPISGGMTKACGWAPRFSGLINGPSRWTPSASAPTTGSPPSRTAVRRRSLASER